MGERRRDSAGRPVTGKVRQGEAAPWIGALLAGALVAGPAVAHEDIGDLERQISWGEPDAALIRAFGARAKILPQPLDFGDSEARVVVRDLAAGGVPLIAFFQMDKRTRGLKRVQLERQRHGVNPPAFRAVVGALEDSFGRPEAACGVAPDPANGYQAAAELVWTRGGDMIRAIFRDTTIEAVEGCLAGELTGGPCGLTGQLLVRIRPRGGESASCPSPRAR